MLTTAEQRGLFRDSGYAVVPSLADDEALAELRGIYDEFLVGSIDCGVNRRQLGGITPQIVNCRLYDPRLLKGPVVEAARVASAELLGCDEAGFLFDMMIYKPPGHPQSTPWHQDLAYFDRPFSPAGTPNRKGAVQFWLALDDADVENGCMHFLPGLHDQPMLEHCVASGDPNDEGRLLAFTDAVMASLDLDAAVACPIPAGSATAHGEGTPHYTPPNTSADRPRRAYIMTWVDPTIHPLPPPP